MSKIDDLIRINRIKTFSNILISRIDFVKDRKCDHLEKDKIKDDTNQSLRDGIVFTTFYKLLIKNIFFQKKLVPITITFIVNNALLGIAPERYFFCFVSPVLAQVEQDIFAAGLEKLKQGDYAKAIADFTEAIRLNPDNTEIYFNNNLGVIPRPLGRKI